MDYDGARRVLADSQIKSASLAETRELRAALRNELEAALQEADVPDRVQLERALLEAEARELLAEGLTHAVHTIAQLQTVVFWLVERSQGLEARLDQME